MTRNRLVVLLALLCVGCAGAAAFEPATAPASTPQNQIGSLLATPAALPTPTDLPATSIPTPCIPAPTPTPSGGTNCVVPTSIYTPVPIPTTSNAGLPAIHPSIQTTDPLMPAFTADEAAQYVLKHPFFGRLEPQGPITVTSVQFLTTAQDPRMLAGWLEPDRLLCIVQVSGTFRFAGAPVLDPSGTPRPPVVTAGTAFQIFDAHTGNQLALGGGP